MKKLFLMIALTSFVVSGVAFSEGLEVDLQSMSIEDLLNLKREISNEITSRISDDVPYELPIGVYEIGKDFSPGSYNIEVVKSAENENPYFSIQLYESIESYKSSDGEIIHDLFLTGDENEGYIRLDDGNVMAVYSQAMAAYISESQSPFILK